MKNTLPTAEQIQLDWDNNPRWKGIKRGYTAQDVVRLRGRYTSSIRWPGSARRSCGSTSAPSRS